MNIKIEYDGKYPNLCSGSLIVIIDGTRWVFPDYCMSSGGSVSFDEDWNEDVTSGEWSISDWPDGFPDNLQMAVEEAINIQVSEGCCGGCL